MAARGDQRRGASGEVGSQPRGRGRRRLVSPPLTLSPAARGDARVALEEAAAQRRVDWRRLSLAIGRNAAYIQQYLRRGTPRRLDEDDRAALAAYLEMDEALLRDGARGGAAVPPAPLAPRPRPDDRVAVARLDLRVAAGAGRQGDAEAPTQHLGLSRAELRALTRSPPELLSVVVVEGDSMWPTLLDGDRILVDRGATAPPRREGIYVIRRGEALSVKRLRGAGAVEGTLAVVSDNAAAYPEEPAVPLAELAIVGKVIWLARALR